MRQAGPCLLARERAKVRRWPATEEESALKRSTAKRREPVALSERQVVDAALALIRREGADRFSIWRLAKHLGVTPVAVYFYVRSKDETFELLADTDLSRVERAAPGQGDWRASNKPQEPRQLVFDMASRS
jgi:AcrR family transcriptional regulator